MNDFDKIMADQAYTAAERRRKFWDSAAWWALEIVSWVAVVAIVATLIWWPW